MIFLYSLKNTWYLYDLNQSLYDETEFTTKVHYFEGENDYIYPILELYADQGCCSWKTQKPAHTLIIQEAGSYILINDEQVTIDELNENPQILHRLDAIKFLKGSDRLENSFQNACMFPYKIICIFASCKSPLRK